MKIVTVVGARPQFIKAASLSREIMKRDDVEEVIVHTGQHFDENMSPVFFREMQIPKPKYNLEINSLNHGAMTGRMLEQIETILVRETPDWLLVYGDTNSTLAGALAAKKLHIKVAHVEAGLRSFNMAMPEEINRVLTDRISDILFCPSEKAITNLLGEGFSQDKVKIVNVGDIMCDSAMFYGDLVKDGDIKLPQKNFLLATIHRAENTNDEVSLRKIFSAFDKLNQSFDILLPLHPRTRKYLDLYGIETSISLINPVGYLDMIALIKNSQAIITDSGGLQKEAYFFSKRCFTLRDETEWIELIEAGYNKLLSVREDDIAGEILTNLDKPIDFTDKIYGDGKTSSRILEQLVNFS